MDVKYLSDDKGKITGVFIAIEEWERLQKQYNINAGRTQIMIDSVILALALLLVAPHLVAWSALSAVAMSGMVMAWHRAGRYFGS